MSNFELISAAPTPAEFQEPFGDTTWDRPYGATPARPYGDAHTEERQDNIEQQFDILFKNPPESLKVPDSFRDYLIEDQIRGRIKRNLKNHIHYDAWAKTHSTQPNHTSQLLHRFERAEASINDVLEIATTTDIDAFEIAKVTHPYGQRMEYVTPMRTDLMNAISNYENGEILEPATDAPYRSLTVIPYVSYVPLGSKEKSEIIGITVMYKRDFGVIREPNGAEIRLVERQMAGYRVDEASGFPQDIIKKMTDPRLAGLSAEDCKNFSWMNPQHPSYEMIMKASGCRDFIEAVVQSNAMEDFVVPVETVEYGYRRDPRRLGSAALKP